MFENLNRGACDIVVEGITKAGAHQEDALGKWTGHVF